MNSQEYRNLQEAYLNVYQEIDEATDDPIDVDHKMQRLPNNKTPKPTPQQTSAIASALKLRARAKQKMDEATAMAKRGLDEPAIRNKIASQTRGGEFADKAGKLADRETYGNTEKKAGRENLARKQRGDFRSTTSSSPDLRGYGHQSSDPAVKAKQAARGAQRGSAALTPNERKQLNMESYDLFDYIMEYLITEGYADTNENALVIMANMSEDWRQSIVEAGRLHTSSDQQVGFARIRAGESGGRGKKPMSDAEIKKQKGGQEFLDRIAATKKDPKYKG